MTISAEIYEKNQGVLKLAIKCMLINAQKEKDILAILKERSEQDPECSVIDIFKEEDILSQQKIDFLLSFKKYIGTQTLDIEFGQLAVANNFATKEAVKEALDFQKDCYSKTEQTKEISETLLKKQQISLENSTAILLVQNRIEDDFLAQALDNLAPTEAGKKEINKRFGIIGLKKKLISLEQLNQALASQKGELLLGQKRRHIHIILEESTDLSGEDTISILNEQKQFEKRRLNIENALSTYNTEIKLNTRLNQLFQYRVSEDGIEAYVSKPEELSEKIKVYEFLTWLKQTGIKFGIVNDNTIEDFIFNKKAGEEILVAKGYSSVNGGDESIEFLFDTDVSLSKEQGNDDEVSLVKKGDVLVKIIVGKKGKPGKDVWGHLISPADIKKCFLDCGEGVVRDEMVFVADVDGVPSLRNGRTLLVSPHQETMETKIISKNIAASTKETYKSFDLVINGTIEHDAIVSCHNLILNGDILGNIKATGDVEVQGSVGKVQKTEGEVKQADIFADGDIVAKKNISNAKLETGKKLIAPNAEIRSANIIAANGIILQSVGFSETEPSVLQIGKIPDPKILEIDNIVAAKATRLKELTHQEELEKIENKYQKQKNNENEYLERNNVLKELLIKLKDSVRVQDLKQNQYPDIPENKRKNTYMLEVIKETNQVDAKEQKEHIEKLLDIESGMYKASVEVTKKIRSDQNSRLDQIKSEIEENKRIIEEHELEIEILSMGREVFIAKQEKLLSSEDSMIKIKNQIAKGTVIKGQTSEMVVTETMYGVTLMEGKNSITGRTEIIVEGYFS